MRRLLFPLAVLLCITLAAFLAWAWSTDFFLVRQCTGAGGTWNVDQRVCELSAGPVRQVTVSPRD